MSSTIQCQLWVISGSQNFEPQRRPFASLRLNVYDIGLMRYFRQRSRFVWLGLLALAGQIVLTLGHGHANYEDSLSGAQFGLGLHLEARDQAASTAQSTRHHRETPTDSDDLGGSCAFCWTTARAASLILPGPVIIPLGAPQQTASLQYQSAELLSVEQVSPFESRGPPTPKA
jgi:hypothetical protein